MKKLMTVAGIACATLTAVAADAEVILPSAATITKSYTYVADFSDGPYKQITGSFTSTISPFNDMIFRGDVKDSQTDLPDPYQKGFSVRSGEDVVSFGNNCPGFSCDVNTYTPSYSGTFLVKADGSVKQNGGFIYSVVDKQRYIASSFVVSEVTAVPEPATWALMLAGFGMVGGAIRYRRRNTMVRYA